MTSSPSADLGPFSALAASLQEITEALAATGTQREVLEIVLTPAVRALGAVAGIVLLVDQTDQQLKIAGSQGYEDVTLTIWQEGPLEDHQLISDILRMREARYFEEAGALKEAYPDLERRTGALAAIANAALPMFLDGRPLGIIVLDFTEPHDFTPAERRFLTILAAQCAVALGRAQAIRTLEARVEERTRQLEEERTALEIFVAFTEAVGSETGVQALVQQAITLLVDTCGVDVIYVEREGGVFKPSAWSPGFDPVLLQLLQPGFPLQHSGIAKVLLHNAAAFIDHWNGTGLLIAESEIYQAVAGYPYFVEVDGELGSVLMIGSRTSATWAERDKGIFRAVGRSLALALERARFAQHLETQNAELYVQTRTLEGVAQLARDLMLPGGPQQLIGQVMDLVLSLLPSGYASYWEPENGRWRLHAHRGDVGRPEWQAVRERGFLLGQFPSLDHPWQTRQPYYQGRYDPVQDAAPELTDHLISVATLPVMVRGEAAGVFGIGLFGHRQWSAADRALLETAVQSLGLVLERSAAAQQLESAKRRAAGADADPGELRRVAARLDDQLRCPGPDPACPGPDHAVHPARLCGVLRVGGRGLAPALPGRQPGERHRPELTRIGPAVCHSPELPLALGKRRGFLSRRLRSGPGPGRARYSGHCLDRDPGAAGRLTPSGDLWVWPQGEPGVVAD